MRTRTNAFIFHQALVDLIGSAMILLRSEIPSPEPVPDNAFGWIVCPVWLSNTALFVVYLVSTLNLLSLTMVRYFATVHPLRYQTAFLKHPHILERGLFRKRKWNSSTKYNELTSFDFESKYNIIQYDVWTCSLGIEALHHHVTNPATRITNFYCGGVALTRVRQTFWKTRHTHILVWSTEPWMRVLLLGTPRASFTPPQKMVVAGLEYIISTQ